MVLRILVRDHKDGVMIPVPRYPLYSALLDILGGERVEYFLDEARGWQLDASELERAYGEARRKGVTPRGLVVVNPGNPTGQVMDRRSLGDVARFCADKVCSRRRPRCMRASSRACAYARRRTWCSSPTRCTRKTCGRTSPNSSPSSAWCVC